MKAVAILPERPGSDETTYRAVAGNIQSVGKTAGEALDALNAQLGEEEAGTLIIVQNLRPDRFFSAQQQHRLEELMTRWRSARDSQSALSPHEQDELQALVDAELTAATQRAKMLIDELSR